MTAPNNPPTLADPLAPGLDSKDRVRRYTRFLAEDTQRNGTNIMCEETYIVKLLDAHARDARKKVLYELVERAAKTELPVTVLQVVNAILREDMSNAQR